MNEISAWPVTDITTGEFRCTQIMRKNSLFSTRSGACAKRNLLRQRNGNALSGRLLQRISIDPLHRPRRTDFLPMRRSSRISARGLWDKPEEYRNGLRAASGDYRTIWKPMSAEFLKARRRAGALRCFATIWSWMKHPAQTGTDCHSPRGLGKARYLALIDCTETAMGARRLRHGSFIRCWSASAIVERHSAVSRSWWKIIGCARSLRRALQMSRISSASPRVPWRARHRLRIWWRSKRRFRIERNMPAARLAVGEQLTSCARCATTFQISRDRAELISAAIVDDPPFSLKDGGFIRAGFDPELDEIRDMRSPSQGMDSPLRNGRAASHRNQSLKVRYNRVFGYYIEITSSNLKCGAARIIYASRLWRMASAISRRNSKNTKPKCSIRKA